MPRAFVTGGSGFVGKNLILELVERGWDVTALHRESSRLDDLAEVLVDWQLGDVVDAESVTRAMPQAADAVFHVAADLSLWSRNDARQERVNVGGTRNVVDAALAAGAGKLIHTSSIAAFGMHSKVVDETTPENASRSWIGYLRTKAGAEVEVRRGIEKGLSATILNPANVLGVYDRSGWASMIRRVHGRKLRGVPPGAGSFCHAREVARAHVEAVEHGATGENYLLGGADASYLELAQIAAELSGRPVPSRAMRRRPLLFVSRIAALIGNVTGKLPSVTPEMATLASASLYCSSDKAIGALKYRTVPFRPMVEESHRWLTEAGILR
jgi:nucleoside-diphosphate-sugar epimerase